MTDETTDYILGDAAVDATAEGRRGLLRRRRKPRKNERVLTHCENCGAPLHGAFCARCGQHAIDYHRSLWAVMIDAADSFFNWDTKFLSSLGILLIRPWKLTNDFNAGRRARYVHPLRLYLLASIAFFLMLKLVHLEPGGPIQFKAEDRAEVAKALGKLTGADSVLTPEQQARVDSLRERIAQGTGSVTANESDELQAIVKQALASKMKEKFGKSERAQLKAALKNIPKIEVPSPPLPTAEGGASPSPAATPSPPLPPGIHFDAADGQPPSPFDSWIESRVKSKVGTDGSKAKLFLDTLRNNIPTMMLCCIPLFALVLKVLYLGKRRYYVEHLVYALHIHTFAYLGAVVITLIGMGLARWSTTAQAIVCTALGVAMFVQVFLSIRRVYGQGWFFTTFKFLLGGFVYFFILVTAVGVTAFVTLLLPD